MKTPAERFTEWIDNVSAQWKDRLRGWMVSWAVRSITDALEDMLPEQKEAVDAIVDHFRDDPHTPDYLKVFLEQSKKRGHPALAIVGIVAGAFLMIMMFVGQIRPLSRLLEYGEDRILKSFRLDPLSVITAWRRDPVAYEKYFDDLRDQGWSPERIESLKFFTQAYPSPRDIIDFLAHEVFEPDMVKKYSLMSEWDKIDKEFAKKIGLMPEILELYWKDHWHHPEWGTITELRQRDQITDDDVKDWFRLVEIPEYWRPKMLEVLWHMPNRIEIRMMARYLDLTKDDVIDLLKKAGLHEDFRADAADMMLIMGLMGYWRDMLRNAWMSPEELEADIAARGFEPITAEKIYKRLIKNVSPEKTAAERAITKTDIIKGVKKGVITRGEGMELLMDMGYSEDDADYILTINIPVDEEDVVIKERELTKTDIIKGLKAEIITEDEALGKLLELRYTPLDAEFLLKIYKATIKPPVEAREREASKADIVLAVKKGLITAEEGYLMLQDIGFTPEASQFILMVKAEVSPFSPVSYQEFKDITGKWRKAAGMEAGPEVEAIRQAAAEVVKLARDLEVLKDALEEEERKLVKEEVLPEAATKRRDELRVTLHRAEAALAAARSKYDGLVAEWRHRE